ncbi:MULTISPECIES: ABC transporter permease [Thermomicrobium]|jgi:spermidine/putrescine transport system permease protein|uniref:Spermidine/putrescine transport system permease protein potB n=1 Tax=Thermomicrobium roseum (strain ATCC 27502 / DSM 5159 / P-2) TaxID=309801 RepID=B9KYH6_THERP|nr:MULTISPECIES: ABC transporter permease [Thermomicrobium]ACM06030.1 spermidine/putrescine transport system permease protein potB [Thermomicrobium roseum DSM 5159]MBO9306085.1 ABC transporter permease [Thermomicrobium sp.]MBO9385630.1 ABC transporter permease [Thermomicrobium sp.]
MSAIDRVRVQERSLGWHERASERIRQSERVRALFLAGPGGLWLLLFFLLPTAIVFAYSFARRGPYGAVAWAFTLENYARLFDWLYIRVFLMSVWLALLTTVICLVIGYPFAFVIARSPRRWRNALLVLVLIPFWTNFLVRTYAIMLLLRADGLINNALQWLGLIDRPLSLLFTPFAVVLGLVYGYLPFMILPIYASIEKFDFTLVEAAQDLGANAWHVFWRVLLPLTLPGVLAGSILVFIPSVGAFVTPDLLGGGKVVMIANLINQQFLTVRHWPFGSAISFVLMAIVLAATMLYFRIGETRRI